MTSRTFSKELKQNASDTTIIYGRHKPTIPEIHWRRLNEVSTISPTNKRAANKIAGA